MKQIIVHQIRRAAASIVALLFVAAAAQGGSNQAIPAQYQSLYSSLETQITDFQQQLVSEPSVSGRGVIYSSQVRSASSDNGALLSSPGHLSAVETELQELQALGMNSATIHIDFPFLYAPYYAGSPVLEEYETFYSQVAAAVRGRGMKLIIETQLTKFDANSLNYAKALSWNDYQNGRAQNALAVAKLVHPDYLVVITEPDTEQSFSGQTQVGTIPGSTQMLQTILTTLDQGGAAGIPVGAGVGTWETSFTSWMSAFAAMPVQFLDMHVYPVNHSYLENTLSGAEIAQTAGKEVTISEAWLQKVADNELSSNVAATDSLNPYSFWAPLDSQFLQSLVSLANSKKFTFISPFWDCYFFAYIPPTASDLALTNPQAQAFTAASSALSTGQFTSTGTAMENAILTSPDRIAPATPDAPSAERNLLGVSLTWEPTTDNVGVAGYQVYRGSVLVTTTSSTSFTDDSRTTGSSSYAISAFDAAGNTSPVSTYSIALRR